MRTRLRVITRFIHVGVTTIVVTFGMSSITAADPLGFAQTNLTSDIPGLAANIDPLLKNPWGMAFTSGGAFWIADQGRNVITLYNASGVRQPLAVGTEPSPGRGPTGQVFVGNQGFTTIQGGQANFVVATLDGTIDAWSAGSVATTQVTTPGAVYTGLAVAGNRVYAADSAGGKIDVFDSTFRQIRLDDPFVDPHVPEGFTPFNIENINGSLYVEYAKQGVAGGYIGIFDTSGHFRGQIADKRLDEPWGITLAPDGFGEFGGDLLVGNFGNGMINAFDPATEQWVGVLSDIHGNPIVNSGLWALAFRSPASDFNHNALFFTAGINGEADGLFGEITVADSTSPAPVPEPSTVLLIESGLGLLALARARRGISTRP